MARTVITPVAVITGSGYPALPLAANSADAPEIVADIVDGNTFVHTGREIIIVHNTAVGAQTVTIAAAPDRFGRAGLDIATYSIGIGEIAVFGPFPLEGWRQTDGTMHLNASDVGIKYSVYRLPSVP